MIVRKQFDSKSLNTDKTKSSPKKASNASNFRTMISIYGDSKDRSTAQTQLQKYTKTQK